MGEGRGMRTGKSSASGSGPPLRPAIGLFHRAAAWIGKTPPPPRRREEPVLDLTQIAPPLPRQGVGDARLAAAEWLWGSGFLVPAGADLTLRLARPLPVGPKTQILDLTAGLGGSAKALHEGLGVAVTAIDPDPGAASLSLRRIERGDPARLPAVRGYDPETLDLVPHGFHAILGRDITLRVTDKPRLIAALVQGLAPRGHLALFELAQRRVQPPGPSLLAFRAACPDLHDPWALPRLLDALKSAGFQVHGTEDMSGALLSLIHRGFARLARALERGQIPRDIVTAIPEEMERVTRLEAALSAGELGAWRLHGIRR